ncbi:MAG: DUF6688 family protein [Pirellulaceae bacterium]|nr:DUF6688 family protein [Pirellulaceae bacterium]
METATHADRPVADSELSIPSVVPILQWSGQRRFKYFVTGVLGPIGCLTMAWMGVNARLDGLWQSGELETYIKLMLEPPALLPFIPLLVFSMLSLSCCCIRPQLAKHLWVRVGVYGGGILSTQYLIFVVFAGAFFPFISAAILGPILALVTYVAAKLMPKARRITIFQLMLLTAVVAVLASIGVWIAAAYNRDGSLDFAEIVFGAAFWGLLAAPPLNCFTYVRATFAILRSPALESVPIRERYKLFGMSFAWLLGFGASWKYGLDAMLKEYANLPTSPPNCYVSSAAACGHPRFVGVTQCVAVEGQSHSRSGFPVNMQMCRLKFLELAMAAFSPALHKAVRRLYDFIGPRAASLCRSNVWFADASYVALKPVEWLACVIQALSGVSSGRIRGLYTFFCRKT